MLQCLGVHRFADFGFQCSCIVVFRARGCKFSGSGSHSAVGRVGRDTDDD